MEQVSYETRSGATYSFGSTPFRRAKDSSSIENFVRANYLSPDDAKELLYNVEKKRPVSYDELMNKMPYQKRGGHVVAERKDGKLRFSEEVIRRHPAFSKKEQVVSEIVEALEEEAQLDDIKVVEE